MTLEQRIARIIQQGGRLEVDARFAAVQVTVDLPNRDGELSRELIVEKDFLQQRAFGVEHEIKQCHEDVQEALQDEMPDH